MKYTKDCFHLETVKFLVLVFVCLLFSGCGLTIPGSDPVNNTDDKDNGVIPVTDDEDNGVIPIEFDGEIRYYQRLAMGETVKIPDLGEFKFERFVFGDITDDPDNRYAIESYSGGLLEFSYYNISTDLKHFYSSLGLSRKRNNDLFIPIIRYKNEDNPYLYDAASCGMMRKDNVIWTDVHQLQPLTNYDLAVGFSLPEGFINSTDGHMSVLLDFNDDKRYILILREDGVNLY